MPTPRPSSRLDLNLLPHLAALLSERSVSRAAARLQLSQPSLSAALARLRVHFDDPLLVRRGNTYDLSPLAIKLVDQVTATVESARRIFEEQGDWDVKTTTREFTLYMSDYGLCTIAPLVARLAAAEAPGVRFRFLLQDASVVNEAEERLRSVDALVIPHGLLTGLPYVNLWQDRWVIVADSGNEAVQRGLTSEDLARLPWVHAFQSRNSSTPASRQLQYLGFEPRVELTVESFQTLPMFVKGTSRLGLVQRGLLTALPSLDGLVVVEPPMTLAPLTNALWWHPVHHNDPGHVWLRGLFQRAGELYSA